MLNNAIQPQLAAARSAWSSGHEHRRQVFVPHPSSASVAAELSMSSLMIAAALAVVGTNTSNSLPTLEWGVITIPGAAAAGVHEENLHRTVAAMLKDIRKRTALTWGQLARIFAVSRRAVHHWASGSAVTADNTHKVKSLYERVADLGPEEAYVTRSRILAEYGLESSSTAEGKRSEPILVADQTPLSAPLVIRKTSGTRMVRS